MHDSSAASAAAQSRQLNQSDPLLAPVRKHSRKLPEERKQQTMMFPRRMLADGRAAMTAYS